MSEGGGEVMEAWERQAEERDDDVVAGAATAAAGGGEDIDGRRALDEKGKIDDSDKSVIIESGWNDNK